MAGISGFSRDSLLATSVPRYFFGLREGPLRDSTQLGGFSAFAEERYGGVGTRRTYSRWNCSIFRYVWFVCYHNPLFISYSSFKVAFNGSDLKRPCSPLASLYGFEHIYSNKIGDPFTQFHTHLVILFPLPSG